MDLAAHAKFLLGRSRMIGEGIIKAFTSLDHWLYQARPGVNHPLWIVGHLGLADNMFISRFRADRATKPEGWDSLFWMGSQPSAEPSLYPSPETVVNYYRERRSSLLTLLDDLSADELNAPAPAAGERSPIAGAPCVGHLFLFAAMHEGMHNGQLSIAHRSLGNAPLR